MKIFGLILCGGKSSRMGQDKSLLNYHGKPQREHLTDMVSPFCDQIFWSVNKAQSQNINPIEGVQILKDNHPDEGPIGGIITAFEKYQEVAWLVVSCDLPRLTAATFQHLFDGRHQKSMATAFADSRLYPFVSIWESSIFSALQNYWEQGGRSPVALLKSVDVQVLAMPNPDEFLDVNDDETYQLISKT